MRPIDLTGNVYERLTVIEPCGRQRGQMLWLCVCSCGKRTKVPSYDLRSGNTKSCGCLRVEHGRQHGALINCRHGEGGNGHETPEYRAWCNMLSRCQNRNHRQYSNYGGRGIEVCAQWQVYENFLADMGRRPTPRHSIDRIDNDGDYEPGNVRWATWHEQNNNRRGSWKHRKITIAGETRTLTEWLAAARVSRSTFHQRLRSGKSPAEALLTPPQERGRRHPDYGKRHRHDRDA